MSAPRQVSFAARATFAIAALVAIASIAGLASPSTYARETASWAAQGKGQDWADLLIAVPCLIASAVLALRGSRRAALLLGGALAYTVYTFAIYAFAVHFNGLFLVYCATLGLSAFALVHLVAGLASEDARAWYAPHAPVRLASGFLIGPGITFALLWLGSVVPALLAGTVPVELAETALATNPVHVIDLSVVLPSMIAVGIGFARGGRTGALLAPILLSFSVLMAIAIAILELYMVCAGVGGSLVVAGVLAAMSAASAIVVVRLLRAVRA
jgi:hypothetical protein